MQLRKLVTTIFMTVVAFAVSMPAFAETPGNLGQGQAIVTVLPSKNGNAPVNLPERNLRAEVNGKESSITGWTPLRGSNGDLEIVILIDSSARSSIGLQFEDINEFIRDLPVNVKVAVGYLNAGRAVLTGPLSSDHTAAEDGLRITSGVAGSNGSLYLCLSDIAKHWPSRDLQARREVILISDGLDNYFPGLDTQNPYLNASIRDSIRAGLVVYSIYMPNRGRAVNPRHRSFAGQSLLTKVTEATGGYSYWDGSDKNPVSFRPYLDDIAQRLQNQYRLRFQSHLTGKPEIQSMRLRVVDEKAEVIAPKRVRVSYPIAE
jgi:hypothetical protein